MTTTGSDPHGAPRHVTSADGTVIGYRTHGRGPGLVVVHGGMESSADYSDLADALSGSFTTHVLDRRGRGASGPYGAGHGLGTEVDDVRAVVDATGAHRVFGVSSGGAIALQAALDLPAVDRVAAYEPAISVPGAQSRGSDGFAGRFTAAVDRGETADAMVTLLRVTQMGPRWLRWLPRPVAVAVMRRFVEHEQGSTPDGGDGVVSLLPTMRYDFGVEEEVSADLGRFRRLECPTLLLGGSRSPRYLDAALAALEQLVPAGRRVELRGAGHTAAGNRRQGGRPDLVARELLEFFAEDGPGDGPGDGPAAARRPPT